MKNSNAMKSKCLIFCCFIIGLLLGWPIIQVNAQNVSTIISKHQISGIVKDAKGEPVIGASVVEKGTTNGTMTDIDGHFKLSVKINSMVIVSSVGFVPRSISIGDKSSFDVLLNDDSKVLNEVVVVGFGVQKKVNVTGSVGTVDASELASRPVTSAVQALQGAVPGLQITQTSGSLANTPSINVRGITTIGKGSSGSPLILIDGMEGDLNSINPQDIESISVLKDASASSIYGSRAPFGVILVTTKSGKSGKVSINYNNSFRTSSPINLPKEMDSYTFATYFNAAAENANWSGPVFDSEHLQRIQNYMNGTLKTTIPEGSNGYWGDGYATGNDNIDWFSAIYKSHTFSQEHDLSASGGSDKMDYYVSLNYLNNGGLMRFGEEGYNRYTATGKINSILTKWAKFNYTSRFTRTDYKRPSSLGDGIYEGLGRQGWPTLPLYDPNGYLYSSPSPALSLRDGGVDKTQTDNIYQQGTLILEPIKNWITNINFNYRTQSANNHYDTQTYYNHDVNGNAYAYGNKTSAVYESLTKLNYYNLNIYSEYSFKIKEDHNFKIMGGFQCENLDNNTFSAKSYGIIVSTLPVLDLTTGLDENGDAKASTVSGSNYSWSTAGFFGRLNYDYAGKYLAEVNVRYDGTSRFRSDQRWNIFPSFSLGWNIARESFWKPLVNDIGILKLRLSYGELGNQNTDNYYPTYQSINYYANSSTYGTWLQDGSYTNVATVPALVSSSLTWEKVKTWNIGLDWGALNNRLTGSFDAYIRKTNNMVGPAQELPAVLGIEVPTTNNTDLKTYGWELSLDWRDKLACGLNYGIKLSLADSKTKITRYPNSTGSLSTYYKGENYGDIWGYKTIGLAKTDDEMNTHLASANQDALGDSWAAGDVMYADLSGDNKIDNGANTLSDHGDLKVIGNTTPRYQFGLDFTADYKGFDFRCFFQGVAKRDYFASSYYFWGVSSWGEWWSTGLKQHNDYWTANNTNAYYPRPIFGSGKNQQTQTRYLQNAAYIRLKNLQIGYSLPDNIVRKIGINKLRMFVSGENLWTGTHLTKIYDPETIGYDTDGKVSDCLAYPLSKTFSCGLSITF
jgi:TonB-linked SusC/RagA family outer membrane protein